MRVEFNRDPGYGDDIVMDLDVVPREGDEIYVDGRLHKALRVVWFLNDYEDPDVPPTVRVNLGTPALRINRHTVVTVQDQPGSDS